jgi:hypothetical protein
MAARSGLDTSCTTDAGAARTVEINGSAAMLRQG